MSLTPSSPIERAAHVSNLLHGSQGPACSRRIALAIKQIYRRLSIFP